MLQCYPLGYFGTGAVHYAISYFFPPKELGKVDERDIYGTFAPGEKTPFGILVGVHPEDIEAGGSDSGDGESVPPKLANAEVQDARSA